MVGGSGNSNRGNIPPPVPRPRREGGWTLWLAGCGGLLVLLVAGLAIAGMMASRPGGGLRNIVNTATASEEWGNHMGVLRQALKKSRADHKGAYPATLKELVPKYLAETAWKDTFEGSQAVYTPPNPDASADAVVVSVYVGKMKIGVEQFAYVRLLKDDSIVLDQITRQRLDHSGAGRAKDDDSENNEKDTP